jgi:chaperonin GroES
MACRSLQTHARTSYKLRRRAHGVILAILICVSEDLHTVRNREERVLSHMEIRPLSDRVLVRRIKEEEQSKGGIITPDSAKEKPQEALVVAVGKGKMTDAGRRLVPDVKADDRILFGKFSGNEIALDAEDI